MPSEGCSKNDFRLHDSFGGTNASLVLPQFLVRVGDGGILTVSWGKPEVTRESVE